MLHSNIDYIISCGIWLPLDFYYITGINIVMKSTALLIAILCTSCAYTPSNTDIKQANYGVKPSQPEAAIRTYFTGTLKDPDSLRIQFVTEPKQDWFLNPANFNTKFGYGWHVCAMVNAKNSYSGYVGARPYHFYFNGERIAFVTDAGMNSGRRLQCN